MKISPVHNLSFSSKRKQTKEADKIMRKATSTFPLFSPNYARNFYGTLKPQNKNCKMESGILNKFSAELIVNRAMPNLNFSNAMPYVKRTKTGNCYEKALITMGCLAANGYKNVSPCLVNVEGLIYKFDDKEPCYSKKKTLDHIFLLADMDNDGERETVIDPWLGFAGTKGEAKENFHRLINPKDFIPFDFVLKRLEIFSPEDYKMKFSITLVDSKEAEDESTLPFDVFQFELPDIEQLKTEFPELIIKKDIQDEN